jgi:LysM repeat protein
MPNYKIKKGDTLSAIAKKEGTTVSELMKLNPTIKDKNMIMSGANLNLPYGMEKLKSNVKSAPAKQAIARMNQTPADIKAMAAQSALINANKKTEKLKTEPKKSGFPTSRARIGGAIKKAKEEPKKNKGRTTFVSSNKGLKK